MYSYTRTIRFHETDAAGVVYFANLLTLCHEAYEASLADVGVDMKRFFSGADEVAVPVVHAAVDFFQPLFCGEAIAITLTPKQLNAYSFEITYTITRADNLTNGRLKKVAQALTRHVSISPQTRRRSPLTNDLLAWIEITAQSAADD